MFGFTSGASPSQDRQGERRLSVYDLDDDSPRPAKNNHGSWTEGVDKQAQQKLLEGVQVLLEGQQRLERLLASGVSTSNSPVKGHNAEAPWQYGALKFGVMPQTSEPWSGSRDNLAAAKQKSVTVDAPGDDREYAGGGSGGSSGNLGSSQPLVPERLPADDSRGLTRGLSRMPAEDSTDAQRIFSKSVSGLRRVRLHKELEGSYEQFEQACAAALGDLEVADQCDFDEDDEDGDHHNAGSPKITSRSHTPGAGWVTSKHVGKTMHSLRRNRLLWGPASATRTTVDLMSILFLTYEAFALPFIFAFDVPMEGTVLYVSMIAGTFWICDMLFRFRCSYFRQDTGTLETRPLVIAANYLKGTFLLDISIISIDIVCVALAIWSQNAKTTETDAFKLARIGKVSRLARVTNLLRLRQMPKLFERISQNYTVNVMHDIMKLTLVIVWLNHVVACVWMPIGKMEGDTGMSWLDSDIGDHGTSYRDGPTMYQYTTSLHWALTQMTPGSMQVFPVNSSERVFNCACLLFGLLVFSTLISSISATVTQFKLAMQKQGDMLDKLNRFLRTDGQVSSELAMQVRQMVKEKLKYKKPLTIKDVEVLELLPLSLKNALQVQVALPMVVSHGYFLFLLEADTLIVEKICSGCCEAHGLGKQDTLFLQFTAARAMYFVKHGELRYATPAKSARDLTSRSRSRSMVGASKDSVRELRGETVTGGGWLSEAALWCDWVHAGSAECFTVAPCEVMKLGTAKMLSVLTENQADLGVQVTYAYARSFASCLSSCQDAEVESATDLFLPFSVDEVMGAMPRKARVLMGHIAISVIRSKTSSYLSLNGHRRISSRKLDKLGAEVKVGKCMVMLNSCSKLGVNRVVALVVLKLERDDGRVLVELKDINDPARISAKLPGAKITEGELPEQCLQRVLESTLGPDLSERVVRVGKESVTEMGSSYQYGIPTQYQKSVFLARLASEESIEKPAEGMSPIVLKTSNAASNAPSDESAMFDPLHKDMLTPLASGHFGAWLTDDEVDHFATPAGKAELSRRLVAAGWGVEPTSPNKPSQPHGA